MKRTYHVLETLVDGVVAAVVQIDLGAMDSDWALGGNARGNSLCLLNNFLL